MHVAPIPCFLLYLVLIFFISIIMTWVLQLWPLTLDRNDPGEDGVTQHGSHSEQNRQNLITPFVGLVVQVTAIRLSMNLATWCLWKKEGTFKFGLFQWKGLGLVESTLNEPSSDRFKRTKKLTEWKQPGCFCVPIIPGPERCFRYHLLI